MSNFNNTILHSTTRYYKFNDSFRVYDLLKIFLCDKGMPKGILYFPYGIFFKYFTWDDRKITLVKYFKTCQFYFL